jgi:alpha-1,2-mannosyltransferase
MVTEPNLEDESDWRAPQSPGWLQRLSSLGLRNVFQRLPPTAPLDRWSRLGLLVLAGFFLLFFAITLYRQAFANIRKGDLDVFFRAGWAARVGADLYKVTDHHGWHYHYPPLLAGLMIPLADPPPDASMSEKTYTLPFWASASIWYWLNVLFVVAGLHIFASALEADRAASGAPPAPPYSQAWWALRVWPLLLTLFPLGDALGSGQLTALLLFAISCAVATMLRGRKAIAGTILGFVGVMKLFPLYLLIYPLLRRDRPMLAGAAAGVFLGLLLPVVLLGPRPCLAAYRAVVVERLLGEAQGQGDPLVAAELHGTKARIQSFEYMILDMVQPSRADRAKVPPTPYFIAHLVISLGLTAGALFLMRQRGDALTEVLFILALVPLMVPIVPVSRPHYYALAAPVFQALLVAEWPRRRGLWPGWPVALACISNLGAGFLAAVNQPQAVDFGLATYAALALTAVAIAAGRRRLDLVGQATEIRASPS